MREPRRRASDNEDMTIVSSRMLVTLYEELVGTPASTGFIPFVKNELKLIGEWQLAHNTEHKKRDEEAKVVRHDLRRTALNVVEKALLAAFSAVLAFVTYLGLGNQAPPGR